MSGLHARLEAAREAGHQPGSPEWTRAIRGVPADVPVELLGNPLAGDEARTGELEALLGQAAAPDLHDAVTAIDGLLRHLYQLRSELVGRGRENQRRLGLG